MTKKILFILTGLMISTSAFAQEYGLLIGVHQTDADYGGSVPGIEVDGVMNFKFGLAAKFELMPSGWFRTGVLYNQRHVEVTSTLANADVNFDYIDVPATFQYNFNEMFGLFGGLVVAVNINDEVDPDSGDPDATKLLPLLTVGANLMFEDMIGFDFYYERGMGDVSETLENYGTFGGNFIYWF